ncbi:MAG TPA: hypothetical protein VMT76_11120 [Puia sp.]|nr:hypothetical protein [Puia sp.]
MKKNLVNITGIILLITACFYFTAEAQSTNAAIKKLTKQRDDFINKIKSLGFIPKLSAPAIVFNNPPSFGNYDDSANKLEMSDWETMKPELKEFFNAAAKQIGKGETGKSYFEKSIYQWVFIHELGHWWATGQRLKRDHYKSEMAANRIAAAYWRKMDASLPGLILSGCKMTIASISGVVPEGYNKENFFNSNYDKLIGTPAYSWYQAIMIIDAFNELPKPTFKKAIAAE